MKSLFKNGALVIIGFIASSYLFIVQGYKTEYVEPGSDRWYTLIQKGNFPQPLDISFSELRSNGYILEVYGTINNPRDKQATLVKVSTDLFDDNGNFFHKCEHWIPAVEAASSYNFKFHCANLSDVQYEKSNKVKVYVDS